jgi:RNA polymerase sigma factor (sigma-70 family)
MMMDDCQLLVRYAKERSQDAFAELVARHLNFVYSAALRQVRSHQAAQDVTQVVFANLARKAHTLSNRMILAGWLHRDTRFTALDFVRAENRRLARDQESCSMNSAISEDNTDWEQVRPWLDESLNRMNPCDRDALLLRFFEQRSHAEIGAALGSGEDAARKRVTRALEKLRELLVSRGVTTTASALSVALAAHGVQTAPAGFAGTIAASSLAAGGAAAAGITAVKIIRLITMAQFKTAALAVVAVAGITGAVIQHLASEKLRDENRGLLLQTQQLGELQSENERLSNLVAQAKQPRLPSGQTAELLRLRGQVGQLRDALAAARSASTTSATTAPRNEAPTDPAQPFTTDLTARVTDGQTLLVGGWSTTPGVRTFILMTTGIAAADGVTTQVATDGSKFDISNSKLTFNTCTFEIPEAMLAQFGLTSFQAQGQESSMQSVLSAADAEALLNALKSPPDGVWVAHGRITTADGIAATMSIVGDGGSPVDGQTAAHEITIGVTPSLTTDQTAANLLVHAQIVGQNNSARPN